MQGTESVSSAFMICCFWISKQSFQEMSVKTILPFFLIWKSRKRILLILDFNKVFELNFNLDSNDFFKNINQNCHFSKLDYAISIKFWWNHNIIKKFRFYYKCIVFDVNYVTFSRNFKKTFEMWQYWCNYMKIFGNLFVIRILPSILTLLRFYVLWKIISSIFSKSSCKDSWWYIRQRFL